MMQQMAEQLQSLVKEVIKGIDVNAEYPAHHRMAEYGGFQL